MSVSTTQRPTPEGLFEQDLAVGASNQKTAIQLAEYVLQPLPFPVQQIQTDNEPEFWSIYLPRP